MHSPSQLNAKNNKPEHIAARQLELSGKVQGVGFRPFIYQLAVKQKLNGWVRNCLGTVEIHIQGEASAVNRFVDEILLQKPSLAQPEVIADCSVDVIKNCAHFEILPSQQHTQANISVPTDLFMCDQCRVEMNDPDNRRHNYPFINCTQCGPRYSLIQRLPYDRTSTSMNAFSLCHECLTEYKDPNDRRFHAEPVACAECGPFVYFQESTADYSLPNIQKNSVNSKALINETAIRATLDALLKGKIIALKGIGGYHLVCDAGNNAAVQLLRQRKKRPHKPLALMFPEVAGNPFALAENYVVLNQQQKSFLMGAERPVLLVDKLQDEKLSGLISPGLNEMGIMLPYSPLHHLLLNGIFRPLVFTSANISGEPVFTDETEVVKKLRHIADAFLHHNRKIVRPVDDSVYKFIAAKPRPIRIGRGVTPLELNLPFELSSPVIAVGAQMKNTITLAWKNRAVVSAHIGEMQSVRSMQVFKQTITDLQALYGVRAQHIICDSHPGYSTSRWANEQALPVSRVLHHHAHASAAYYECATRQKVICFSWDGVGFAGEGIFAGGETFLGKPGAWKKVASMRPFNLPGGEKNAREPWRSAVSLCWQSGIEYRNAAQVDPLIKLAWQKKINTNQFTSVGRLFDAAAALSGLREKTSYEGQAAMELEAQCESTLVCESHRGFIKLAQKMNQGIIETDWQALVEVMQNEHLTMTCRAQLFHNALASSILEQAKWIRAAHNIDQVCFSGGVFQNKLLTEQAMALLTEEGFRVHYPEQLPLNDAGISFGQVMEFAFSQMQNS